MNNGYFENVFPHCWKKEADLPALGSEPRFLCRPGLVRDTPLPHGLVKKSGQGPHFAGQWPGVWSNLSAVPSISFPGNSRYRPTCQVSVGPGQRLSLPTRAGIDHDHCMFFDPNVPLPVSTLDLRHRKIVRYDHLPAAPLTLSAFAHTASN